MDTQQKDFSNRQENYGMRLITIFDTYEDKRLADGCILPDKQVAVAWFGQESTHGTYPNIQQLLMIQSRIPYREIKPYTASFDEVCLGLDTYTFKLVRLNTNTRKNESSESKNNITDDIHDIQAMPMATDAYETLAIGCDFLGAGCVLQWVQGIEEFNSIVWYRNLYAIKNIHCLDESIKILIDGKIA